MSYKTYTFDFTYSGMTCMLHSITKEISQNPIHIRKITCDKTILTKKLALFYRSK